MKDTQENWLDIPVGIYGVEKEQIENQPSNTGIMIKLAMTSTSGERLYIIVWFALANVMIFVKSGANRTNYPWKKVTLQ